MASERAGTVELLAAGVSLRRSQMKTETAADLGRRPRERTRRDLSFEEHRGGLVRGGGIALQRNSNWLIDRTFYATHCNTSMEGPAVLHDDVL